MLIRIRNALSNKRIRAHGKEIHSSLQVLLPKKPVSKKPETDSAKDIHLMGIIKRNGKKSMH